MRRISIALACTAVMLCAASCKKKQDQAKPAPTAAATSDAAVAPVKPAEPTPEPLGKLYGVESGIVHYKTVTRATEDTEVLYFEDFGRRQASYVDRRVKVGKGEVSLKSIVIHDGYNRIEVSPAKKTGNQTLVSARVTTAVDYDELVEKHGEKGAAEKLTKMKLEKLPDGEVLGHKTDVFLHLRKGGEQKLEHHKGVMLRMTVTGTTGKGRATMTKVATKAEFGVPIPPDKLRPAPDIVISAPRTEKQRIDDFMQKDKAPGDGEGGPAGGDKKRSAP